jgi:hypothetical protein
MNGGCTAYKTKPNSGNCHVRFPRLHPNPEYLRLVSRLGYVDADDDGGILDIVRVWCNRESCNRTQINDS